MTPFGEELRRLRSVKGVTMTQMAEALQVSPAYLSALEHGHRGRPSPVLLQQICGYFNIIWDDAEALQHLAMRSHPRVVVDTAGCPPEATELSNLLAERIKELPKPVLRDLISRIKRETARAARE